MSIAIIIGHEYSKDKFYSTLINALYFSRSFSDVKFNAKDRYLGKNKHKFMQAK
jgi:hypothetical protein